MSRSRLDYFFLSDGFISKWNVSGHSVGVNGIPTIVRYGCRALLRIRVKNLSGLLMVG